MNNLILTVFLLAIIGCSNYSTNVNQLMVENGRYRQFEDVAVRGYIFVINGDPNLYQDKESDDHIDVSFDKDMTFDEPLKEEKYICVDIVGRFKKDSEGVIRVGNATSEHGVIVATDIKRCK